MSADAWVSVAIDTPAVGATVIMADLGDAHWLSYHLWYDTDVRWWALSGPRSASGGLTDYDDNPALTNPTDVDAARRWATDVINRTSEAIPYLRCSAITEWWPVIADGRPGWTPLFNDTPPILLPFTPLRPETGAHGDHDVPGEADDRTFPGLELERPCCATT